MSHLRSFLVGTTLLGIAACQTMPYQPYARDVKKRPQAGGVIALHATHRDEDRAKADEMMRATCGTLPVQVSEEGEVVVGQTTNTNTSESKDYGNKRQVGTFLGLPVTAGSDAQSNSSSTATTTQLKEWQITYECVAAKGETPGVRNAGAPKGTKKKTQ